MVLTFLNGWFFLDMWYIEILIDFKFWLGMYVQYILKIRTVWREKELSIFF